MLNRLLALLVAAVMCEDGGPRRGLPERPRIRAKQGAQPSSLVSRDSRFVMRANAVRKQVCIPSSMTAADCRSRCAMRERAEPMTEPRRRSFSSEAGMRSAASPAPLAEAKQAPERSRWRGGGKKRPMVWSPRSRAAGAVVAPWRVAVPARVSAFGRSRCRSCSPQAR